MATVDGLTKTRMLAIEAASVVGGAVDGTGHLILTKHDATTIDAGFVLGNAVDATTSVKGIMQIATNTEAATGTNTTKALTPANVAPLFAAKAAAVHTHAWTDITSVPNASTSVSGVVQLATDTIAATGADTAKAVTSANMKPLLDAKASLTHTHTALASVAANSIVGNNTGSAANSINLTAAQVNTLLKVAWTTITANSLVIKGDVSNPTMGNSTSSGRWRINADGELDLDFQITIGSTFTGGGSDFSVDLPGGHTIVDYKLGCGWGVIQKANATAFSLTLTFKTNTSAKMYLAAANPDWFSSGDPVLATGDVIKYSARGLVVN